MTATLGVVPEWTVGDRIGKALDVAGIGVEPMARYLEVTRQTVGNWRAGRSKPPASALRMIAMLTGVSYDWLRDGDGVVRRQGLEPRTRWLVVRGPARRARGVNRCDRPAPAFLEAAA